MRGKPLEEEAGLFPRTLKVGRVNDR